MNVIAEVLALLVALVLHEYMHGYVAHLLGDNTAEAEGRLTLNPAAHIDPFTTLLLPLGLILVGSPILFAAARPVPFNPWQLKWGRWGAATVAAAGPATNLVIAIIAAALYRTLPYSPIEATFLGAFITVNVALMIFNLIPFPPLDGSRILYAVVSYRVREVMDNLERGGLGSIAILVLLIYFTPLGALINNLIIKLIGLLVPLPGI